MISATVADLTHDARTLTAEAFVERYGSTALVPGHPMSS